MSFNPSIHIGYAHWRKTKRSKPELVYVISVVHRFGKDEFTEAEIRHADDSVELVPGTQLENTNGFGS